MKKRIGALLAFMMVLALIGCGAQPTEEAPDVPQTVEETLAPEMTCRVAVEDTEDTATDGQERIMTALLNEWYGFIGTYEERDFAGLFCENEEEDIPEAEQHAISCRTLVRIRQAAPEDLHLADCDVTLTVTDVTQQGDRVRIDVMENTTMRFADLTVDSELIDLHHIFILEPVGADEWQIWHHEADDNPYFSAAYEEGNAVDRNLPILLRNIERRNLLREETSQVSLACDVAYDRQGAYEYMTEYATHRNGTWYAYDDVGGNCMNFTSQVLLAGGIPMDEEGSATWYWHSRNKLDLAFINVENFLEYARKNNGHGLVADITANFYDGEVGDLVIFGINSDRHATIICDLVKNEAGETIDYLLCSNTTNYRNFPAAAYYYTGQRLVKIYGWNY